MPDPPPAQRDLFAASAPPHAADTAGGGGITVGISIWLVAAVALVAGIVIGFASGYTAGQRATVIQSSVSDSDPAEPLARVSEAPGPSSASQTFTESPVAEPVRVDPPPVVTAPDAPPDAAEPAGPPPVPQARRRTPVEPAASGPGSLQVLSRPSGAQVFVDGRVVGRTPLVIPGVRSGGHDVRIELSGFRRWSTSVQITPGSRTRVAASLEQ
jgi:hypothetical protein